MQVRQKWVNPLQIMALAIAVLLLSFGTAVVIHATTNTIATAQTVEDGTTAVIVDSTSATLSMKVTTAFTEVATNPLVVSVFFIAAAMTLAAAAITMRRRHDDYGARIATAINSLSDIKYAIPVGTFIVFGLVLIGFGGIAPLLAGTIVFAVAATIIAFSRDTTTANPMKMMDDLVSFTGITGRRFADR